VGRYAINSASSASPIAASANDSIIVQNPGGDTKPSVSSDDPESSRQTWNPFIPVAQKNRANAKNTASNHTAGSTSSVIGAYSAMSRSRSS